MLLCINLLTLTSSMSVAYTHSLYTLTPKCIFERSCGINGVPMTNHSLGNLYKPLSAWTMQAKLFTTRSSPGQFFLM